MNASGHKLESRSFLRGNSYPVMFRASCETTMNFDFGTKVKSSVTIASDSVRRNPMTSRWGGQSACQLVTLPEFRNHVEFDATERQPPDEVTQHH
jgi:hypothetical protein